MSKKIITAREILAQKEQDKIAQKFDANGFINQVGHFFLKHEVWEAIYVKPVNFAKHEKLIKTWEITKGWLYIRNCWESDKYSEIFDWKKNKEDFELESRFFSDFDIGCISVDEPFVKNAVAALQIMAGYVVKYDRKKKAYKVTLT